MHTQKVPKIIIVLFAGSLMLITCSGTSVGEATSPPLVTTAPVTAVVSAVVITPPLDTTQPPESTPHSLDTPQVQVTGSPTLPTPTLQVLEANTIPENGASFEDELSFNTSANDPNVGNSSGDGIEGVTFQFFGADGREVYSHTEKTPLYCAFGGGDDGQDCDPWRFSEHNNQWPNGKPAQSGQYRLVVTIRGSRGATRQDERNLKLKLNEAESQPTPTLEPLVSNSFPSGDTFGDELQFQTIASDPSVGSDNGAGIESVTFYIVDSQGNKLHERSEKTPLYCAFGGGDDGQNCNVWRFSEHNDQWPNGTPVENGASYKLQVIVKAKNGQQTQQELSFTIQLSPDQ